MALEDAINKLADAINGYTAAISKDNTSGTTGEVLQLKNVATKKEEPATPTPPTEDTTKPEVQKPEVEDKVNIKVLQDKFATLVDKDLKLAKQVLTELGFAKLGLVPANLHAKALTLTEEALNG